MQKDEQGRTLNKDGSLRKPRAAKPKPEKLTFLTAIAYDMEGLDGEFYPIEATSLEEAVQKTADTYGVGSADEERILVCGPVKIRVFAVTQTPVLKEVK